MRDFERLLESLSEEITCCICLEVFQEPVSIQCGHNFCRDCLMEHWSSGGHQCPECRQICQRTLMPTDFRLKSLVDKIKQVQKAEKRPASLRVSALNGSKGPLQLLAVDEDGQLEVCEEAIQKCLSREEMKKYPVCLISVAGEQCQGKSFLLNYLLRRLHRLDQDAGTQTEVQNGLEWPVRPPTTGGMWIWNSPFVIGQGGRKTVVFLVDMEVSPAIAGKGETSLKFAAFSALLGSYLILNVPTSVREREMASLELFLHVASELERTFCLQPFQHLDILVQDCGFSTTYGLEGGQEFLRDMMQKLQMSSKYPRTLEVLRCKSRCCLLPFHVGNKPDITEDLHKMFNNLNSTLAYTKKDTGQKKLTLGQLANKIKIFMEVLKMDYGFYCPLGMGIAIHNHKVREKFREKYRDFLREQDIQSRSLLKIVQTRSEALAEELYRRLIELLEDSACHLQGDENRKQLLLQEMLKEAEREVGGVATGYTRKRRRTLLASAAGVLGVAVAAPALSLTAVPLSVAAVVGGMASLVAGSSLGAIVWTQIFDKKKD
ncbi:RING finger protein 112 isoform X2 [Rhinatrema bivittatum]|nr:RING finger protein 112 isoform X2 [Rhinatrema bivittatum]XP_029462724.1 RING finger protein 112 isoform X2 [Rhinatrema bivittatum]XP_029462725.1 RING finger protein 112 isoform X2 [Rhinatrema bivittatum]XP_029462726.1 RING finger protein 112 isoform X2 [Rhinatrema bivittatum]XP_029462727.1 RING finger protein 112 isoform X2 [Rhinatrema bivittatum]XP_029462728.1 RING finger protein 112 isoform X2 [Rhinatrema bivittatum]